MGETHKHAEDLALARACIAGDPQAIACFETLHLVQVPRYIVHLRVSSGVRSDVRGALRDRLLSAPIGVDGKLSKYDGNGPLDRWVRVAAIRLALNLQRQSRPPKRLPQPVAFWAPDPARDMLRHRYRSVFCSALERALVALSPRERALARMYYLDGVSMEAVASLEGVARSTISRTLAGLIEHLRSAVRAELQASAGLPAQEMDSLIDVLLSQFTFDFAQAI